MKWNHPMSRDVMIAHENQQKQLQQNMTKLGHAENLNRPVQVSVVSTTQEYQNFDLQRVDGHVLLLLVNGAATTLYVLGPGGELREQVTIQRHKHCPFYARLLVPQKPRAGDPEFPMCLVTCSSDLLNVQYLNWHSKEGRVTTMDVYYKSSNGLYSAAAACIF